MKVLLYGPLADQFGREIEVDASEASLVGELRQQLRRSRPAAARDLDRSRAIIGGLLVGDDHPIACDGPVEFLPPVSGG